MISLYSDMKRMFTREPAQQILPSNSGDLVHSGQVTHPRQSVAPRRDNRYQHRAPRLSALRPERNPAGDLRVLAVRHDEAIPRSRHAPPQSSRHTLSRFGPPSLKILPPTPGRPRPNPPAIPDCAADDSNDTPKIATPLRGVTYTLRRKTGAETIPLEASTAAASDAYPW